MKRILLAGSTGYLGSYILKELIHQEYQVKTIVRNPEKIANSLRENNLVEIIKAEITQPESITDCCENIDVVISTVGITRQRDGLTYIDVDYQANVNLLKEALKAGARKFIYVSVFKGDTLRNLKIMDAKERFVDLLINSDIDYTIIRPTGFFSDMGDFLDMAKKGKVYLFGDGHYKMNPIHGADLAEVCVKAVHSEDKIINIGGPDVLTQNEIGTLALKSWSKKIKVVHLPDWIRKLVIWVFRTFTSSKTYGPIEFFLTALANDAIAPQYGQHKLETYFNSRVITINNAHQKI